MSDLRLVIFDVDGTLVDSQGHIVAAMEAGFAAIGRVAPPPAAVLSIVGLSLEVGVMRLAPDLTGAEAARLVGAYRQAFFDLRVGSAASPLYPGAAEALEVLAARDEVLLGIATGKSRRGLDHVLDAHGLTGLFVTLQVSDHHPSKPHPAMVEAALKETGAAAGDAVMIGDTEFDMEMGRAAGVRTLGVSWGYHGAERLSAAERVIDRFDALVPALDGLWEV
ncbi:phosphoglycolate phosphatase [Rhodovulum iodosum]|uniref:Phosphoglycolate phosphatase n=1 Tax=Rhodovulum iodosum TaxID=68291 RepID=A0ABV3XXM7_9RHOB|nr:HAD-IA family hydrolase [Rhodovulum robiginosum]RSK38057.1 HAD family hydrolase [Rhodovulum robiginosum]